MIRLSIKSKFAAGTIVIMALVGIAVIIFLRINISRHLEHELVEKGLVLSKHFASIVTDSVLTENEVSLHMQINEIIASDAEIKYVIVIDPEGRVMAHTFGESFPSDLFKVNELKKGDNSGVEKLMAEDGIIIDIAAPVLNGDAGYVRVGFSGENMAATVRHLSKAMMLVVLTILVIGCIGAVLLGSAISRPIAELKNIAEAVGKGDLNVRSKVVSGDEVGLLAGSFNLMMDKLENTREELEAALTELENYSRHLENEVEKRTADLLASKESLEQEVIERKRMEKTLKVALEESRLRRAEVSALLECARVVIHYREFGLIARAIFDSCKALIGADAGYVALLSSSGTENEVLFLDSGGLPCTVEPSLPMPIRGLRAEAYKTGSVVYDNEFSGSEWMRFIPEGHVGLKNVLFAPMVIEGKTMGLMGIANKEGGFTDNDAHLAAAFGELAAVALNNTRALESLEESEERFRAVAQSASDAIISSDHAGNIVFWNRAAETVFGYSAKEAVGKSLAMVIPENFRKRHEESMSKVRATGQLRTAGATTELMGLRKDGTEFPVEISLSRWNTGKGVFFSAIIRDITQRRLAEKETIRAAQLTSVGELAAGVAYEINNPLNGIINYAEILAAKVQEDRHKEVAGRIVQEGDRISRVVRSLLSFTRKMDGKTQPVRVEDMLSEVLDLVSLQLAHDGIEVNLRFVANLPYIRVAPQHIEQVFLGLIANAKEAINNKQYSNFEKKNISIEGKRVDLNGNDFVKICFADNGVGMPKDVVRRAMDPFFTTKGKKGTGLGLSISHVIVNDHGGKMEIESEEGRFTRVTIYLPAGRGSDAA